MTDTTIEAPEDAATKIARTAANKAAIAKLEEATRNKLGTGRQAAAENRKPLKPRHIAGAVKVKRIKGVETEVPKTEAEVYADRLVAELKKAGASSAERGAVLAEHRADVAADKVIGKVVSQEAKVRLQKYRDEVNRIKPRIALYRLNAASTWGAQIVGNVQHRLDQCGLEERSQVGEALLVHLLEAVRVAQEAAGVTRGGSGAPIKLKRSRKPVSSKAVDPVAGMVLN